MYIYVNIYIHISIYVQIYISMLLRENLWISKLETLYPKGLSKELNKM